VIDVSEKSDGVVERFLDRMVAHDWDGMAACVTDDVERTGPFCDVYRGKAEYVAFISKLMPSLAGYAMKVDRVVYTGRVAVAELTESVDGTDTPEALVFDLDDDDRIARISIYIRRPEFAP
jgi:hypothetical protein